jgi:hypothetical protein
MATAVVLGGRKLRRKERVYQGRLAQARFTNHHYREVRTLLSDNFVPLRRVLEHFREFKTCLPTWLGKLAMPMPLVVAAGVMVS